MPKPDRPVLPFTLHGQRQIIACALLALGFLLALALYLQWGRVRDLRAALAAPLPRTLVLPGNLLAVTPDPAWGAYAILGSGPSHAILLRERPEGPGAIALLQATRADALAVRALDLAPALLATKVSASHAAAFGTAPLVSLLGVETRTVRPGVSAAHFFFDIGDASGEGILFLLDDVEYLFWGLRGDAHSPPLAPFFATAGGSVELPDDLRDRFDRPVIDSGALSFARTRALADEAAREAAAARAAAERDETLPALAHIRKALRLYASIHQEDLLLASPDAARFRDLVAKRRDELAACFARVDRARAMGDIAAAREAAAFIRDNATLDGETADRLRAEAILRALPPPPQQ